MNIWILSKLEHLGSYETKRFRETAERTDIAVRVLDPRELEIVAGRKERGTILRRGRTVFLPDCLIPRTGAGTTYFAVSLIRQFEQLGVPVLNSSQSIQIARDKFATVQTLSASGIPVPKTMLACLPFDVDVVEREIHFPLIAKTACGSYGNGVLLCESRTDLEERLSLMDLSGPTRPFVVLQEFVRGSRGRDVRVIVVGGKVIGGMLRTAQGTEFRSNVSAGASVSAYRLTPEIETLAVESAEAIGLEVAGVDILFDGEGYRVCEVNSAPGFQGFEKATGVDVPLKMYECIRTRMTQNHPVH